ncbi:MAG: SGNH/GDSL hydrolase family protein, partial [Bacillota bacterium]|nr:SGNH/GDSL hydrolase family protein [Bacillota bacterium]
MRKLVKIPGSVLSEDLQWYDPQQVPELLFGLNWFDQERLYRRLPKAWAEPFPEAVERLAWHTSGAQLRFLTDSPSLTLRARLSGPPSMVHMPATGQCGFDCYLDDGQGLYYYSTTKYPNQNVDQTIQLFKFSETRLRQVAVHFPLYLGVDKVEVGIEPDATVFEPWPYPSSQRLVFYGTSITQGGCAARPGMSYTNIIGDILNMSCINLGFSGSGKGEP